MRLSQVLCVFVLLSACSSGAPYSNVIDTAGGGVGFSDYAQYMRAQEELSRIRRTEAASARTVPRTTESNAASTELQPQGFGSAQTQMPQQATLGQPIETTRLQTQTPAGQQPQPQPRLAQGFSTGEQVAAAPSSEGVSSQSYEAQPFGSARQNRVVRREYVPQVRVTAAEAPAASGPNLFVYALSTQHDVGEERYTRRNPFRWRQWESACAEYPHQDLAQEAFLAAGGPEKDTEHMDPDGDGYACWWDPAPFRQAATTVKARE